MKDAAWFGRQTKAQRKRDEEAKQIAKQEHQRKIDKLLSEWRSEEGWAAPILTLMEENIRVGSVFYTLTEDQIQALGQLNFGVSLHSKEGPYEHYCLISWL